MSESRHVEERPQRGSASRHHPRGWRRRRGPGRYGERGLDRTADDPPSRTRHGDDYLDRSNGRHADHQLDQRQCGRLPGRGGWAHTKSTSSWRHGIFASLSISDCGRQRDHRWNQLYGQHRPDAPWVVDLRQGAGLWPRHGDVSESASCCNAFSGREIQLVCIRGEDRIGSCFRPSVPAKAARKHGDRSGDIQRNEIGGRISVPQHWSSREPLSVEPYDSCGQLLEEAPSQPHRWRTLWYCIGRDLSGGPR